MYIYIYMYTYLDVEFSRKCRRSVWFSCCVD